MGYKISTPVLSIILATIIIINFMYNMDVLNRLDALTTDVHNLSQKEVILECNP